MSIRAIFNFRNLDKTRDFNDRFSKLFYKGFFDGAELTLVSGELKVDIAPFKAISDDGMVVVDTNSTRVTVLAGAINYVVLRAVYQDNEAAVLQWENLEQSAYLADSQIANLIVRAIVTVPGTATSLTSSMVSTKTSHLNVVLLFLYILSIFFSKYSIYKYKYKNQRK